MKAIVTGGAGFIGSNLVDELIAQGHTVTVVDDLSSGVRKNINGAAEFRLCDISTNLALLSEIFAGGDVVFHLAASARVEPSIKSPISFNDINVGGTLNVLVAAKDTGIKRVVYSASSAAYGNPKKFPTRETAPTNPLSPYGLQKLIGEQYCKLFSDVYNLDTCSLRYFNVYGERMPSEGAYCLVLGVFTRQKLKGEPLTIVNTGEQRRDFTYVGDVSAANIKAAEFSGKLKGEVFNIGNGKNYSVNEIATMMGGPTAPGEKRLEPFETLADNTKAQFILGWNPMDRLESWIISHKRRLGI